MICNYEEKYFNIVKETLELSGIKVHKNGSNFPKKKFEIRV